MIVQLRAIVAHMWSFKFVASVGMVIVSSLATEQPAAALALAYTGGMMMCDWVNDLYVARLVKLMRDMTSACSRQSAIIKMQQEKLDSLERIVDGIVGPPK
jgi:hypothetical protein